MSNNIISIAWLYFLRFSDFALEESSYCNQDYVEIRETNSSGRLFGRYCGSSIQTSNTTVANQLWIKFKSDNQGVAKGFLGTFNLSIVSSYTLKQGFHEMY